MSQPARQPHVRGSAADLCKVVSIASLMAFTGAPIRYAGFMIYHIPHLADSMAVKTQTVDPSVRAALPAAIAQRRLAPTGLAPTLPQEGPAQLARSTFTALSGALALLGAGLGGELPAGAEQLLAIARRNCALLERVIEQQYPSDPKQGGTP